MFHHEFIVDHYTLWVTGDVSKLEAFASICIVFVDQFMVSAFVMNFSGATPLECKELDKLPQPASSTVRVVRRPMGPLPNTQAIQAPQGPFHVPYLRHEHVVLAAAVQTLVRLHTGARWSMVALRQPEDLHLPSVDYSLTNNKRLIQLCHLLLQKNGLVAAQGWQAPPPHHATLTLGLYADGYQPRGRPNISTKIRLIDFEGLWFSVAGSVPVARI